MRDRIVTMKRQQLIPQIAPWLALCLLLGAAALLIESQTLQFAVSKQLVQGAKQGWHEANLHGLMTFFVCGFAFALLQAVSVLFLLAVFLLVETLLNGHPPRDWRRVRMHVIIWLLLSLLTFVLAPLLNKAMPISQSPLIVLDHRTLSPWIGNLASGVLLIALTLCYDFLGYWEHRLQHAVPLLWRFHAVHHSIEAMDSLGSFSHPIDGLVERAAIMVLAALVGFHYESVLILQAFLAIHGSLNHTSARVNLGRLGGWIVDNRTHFLHHTPDEAQAGVNFGSVTTIWDRVFGTYRAPVDGPLPPTGLADHLPPQSLRDYLLASPRQRPI